MDDQQIRTFRECTSQIEKKQRPMMVLLNLIVVPLAICFYILLVAASFGIILIPTIIGWLATLLFSEYSVRKIQAAGVTVTADQLPELWQASEEVRQQFDYKHQTRVIILNESQANAFAIRFARKKVILLNTELLDALADDPAQLRFVLGHEYCHLALDHSWLRFLVYIKPVRFRYGREMTCDNAGMVASGDFEASASALCKVVAGPRLAPKLNPAVLVEQADTLESGFAGWCVRNWLVHPPLGKRLYGMSQFAAENPVTFQAHGIALGQQSFTQLPEQGQSVSSPDSEANMYTPKMPD